MTAPVSHQAAAHSTDGGRFSFEIAQRRAGSQRLAGIDEAGRGPLAGPVVAAAVILPDNWIAAGLPPELHDLNDSKQVSPQRRDALFAALQAIPETDRAVAIIPAPEIDATNILRATHQAMARALNALLPPPDHVLVDGLAVPTLPLAQTAIVKGDALSYSIAAASILAKVTRDRLMVAYDRQFPGYGFARHKGYPTPDHLEALRRLGPSPIHRRTFAPLKQVQGVLPL